MLSNTGTIFIMNNNFLSNFLIATQKEGHLVPPAIAAKLLNVKRQYINQLEKEGKLKKLYIEDQPFIGMNSINAEIIRRQAKK